MIEVEEIKESFLPFVALFVPGLRDQCYAMRFVKEEQISEEREIEGSFQGEREILDYTASVEIIDAIFLKRPYIKIKNAAGPVEGKVRIVLDGETVSDGDLSHYPVEDRLGDEPFRWRTLKNYWGSKMDSEHPAAVMSLPWAGLMMTAHTPRLQAFIWDVRAPKDQKIQIEMGVVAALYSTKRAPKVG